MTLKEIVQSKIILLSLIFIIIAFYFLFRDNIADPVQQVQLPEVTLVEIKETIYQDEILAVGTTQSIKSVTLSPSVTETVTKIHFRDGQAVKKDDVIVDLSSDEESAQLEAALNILKERKAQFARSQKLFKQKFTSQAKHDQDKRALHEAQAEVKQLKARLADRLITAPFDGVLGLKDISLGALVQPGIPIVTLDKLDQIKLDFNIPEKFLKFVKKAKVVQAVSDAYTDKRFEGKILSIDSRIDTATRTFKVRVIINNKEHLLKSGMFMRVQLLGEKRSTIFIPDTAILSKGYEKFVYRYDGSKTLQQVQIQTGIRTKDAVEVTQGLKFGDQIVYEGLKKLRIGQEIKPILRRDGYAPV